MNTAQFGCILDMNSMHLLRSAGIESTADREIHRIVRYAHLCNEHSIFVDITNEDQYVEEALRKGALVLSERKLEYVIQVSNARKTMTELLQILYDFPCRKIKLIGVTGTCGKSTVVHLVKECLKDQGIRSCSIMSGKAVIDDKVEKIRNTTPDASFLIPLMNECIQKGIHYLIMEVSSEAYLAHRVEGFLFDVMIGTVIASDHLDSHKSLEHYHRTKKNIFSLTKSEGVVILNYDDVLQRSWMSDMNAHVLTYGFSCSAFQISKCQCALDRTSFMFQQIPVSSRLLSSANVYNLSAAIICAFVLDLNMKQVFAWAARVKGCPGRFEKVHDDPLIFVDYAHTEAAVHEVLSFFRQATHRKIICVFGCGGNRDRSKRPLMAEAVCRYADEVIVTMDNPRNEPPSQILEDILAGCTKQVHVEVDRMKAIQFAVESCTKDDIIILLGKGDETSLFTCGKMMPYSDKEAVLRILREEY